MSVRPFNKGSSGAWRMGNGLAVKSECSAGTVGEKQFQGFDDCSKRQVGPWNLGFGVQACFQAFFSGSEPVSRKFGEKKKVDLMNVRNIDESERTQFNHMRAGLFHGFASRALCGGLTIFHEPGGQSPVSIAWFDRTPAKQDAPFPLRDATHHEFWIFIVDDAARRANCSFTAVARRYPPISAGAALTAMQESWIVSAQRIDWHGSDRENVGLGTGGTF